VNTRRILLNIAVLGAVLFGSVIGVLLFAPKAWAVPIASLLGLCLTPSISCLIWRLAIPNVEPVLPRETKEPKP
jgi:hypothetical protein